VQVLLDDVTAEHIPGCNMAFRKSALAAIGGFDPLYRTAGDDVDVCWRLQERGWKLGFAPAAVVWHHRRNSVRAYWKQQRGYGRAEALLEAKWPQRYNAAGHVSWRGQLYGRGLTLSLGSLQSRVYRGVWGSAPFQCLYQGRPAAWLELPLMPEWLLLLVLLAALSLLGLGWRPLLLAAAPCLLVAAALPVAQAMASARRSRFSTRPLGPARRLQLYGLTAFLHLLQPVARLLGRLQHGLVPWRRRGPRRRLWRLRRVASDWREAWTAPAARLEALHAALVGAGAVTTRGGEYDDWDLEVRGGWLGGARLRLGVEEHGAGKQMLRFRIWMRPSRGVPVVLGAGAALASAAAADGAGLVAACLAAALAGLGIAAASESARALATLDESLPAAAEPVPERVAATAAA
jgi:hypothetical protein